MLARQRSGTNALRHVLDGHPGIFPTPEVFHAEPSLNVKSEWDMNFFRFLEQHPKGTASRSQSLAVQEEIFLDFLDFLKSFSNKQVVVIDVKLNSTHHLDGPWRSISEVPSLFAFMVKHRVRVLHLTRRNYLRYYLSVIKANLTRTWTARSGEESQRSDDPRVRVDLGELKWRMERCAREEEMTTTFLGGRPGYISFDYDDMFPVSGAPIAGEVLERISAWLDLSADFGAPDPFYRKQSVLGLTETIENYSEVEDALRGTPFEYCLQDERAYRSLPAQAVSRR